MTQSLRFGIVHDFRCPPGSDVTMPQVYAETFEQVVLAEQLGLEQCWFTEHHFIEDGYLPNFVPVAGAAAALTNTMRFSTDICLMPFRDPVRLAEDLAVLDNISDGRMELGIGMGYAAHEFAGFGLPVSRRVSLTEEAIDVLRLAWSGEPFSYEGKRYSYRDLRVTPDPVQPGGPPLWVAATSEAGALRAARFDTNLLPQGPKAAVLDPWKEALAADGRDPGDKRVGIIRGVYVTDGRDPAEDPTWEAIAAAEKYRRDVYIGIIKASADHKATARERAARTGPREPDPLNPLVWTVGDADHCVAELTSMIRDHDVTDLVTWGGPPGLPPSVMNASLERFASDVIPRIHANLTR
ncbi:MAG: LLM class flavin-dependent oxidoreductase [Acidimicrobiales bacterium]|nr:LLM class flavin-dependent oxidoreductase [Acidimicrobiales bacterium]MYG87045.1 LLM class flavin-dependent oxidoreductase [Acidimicrobiales bacterium]MYI27007.1 LLM class flavin-dependent oxidoreductase [Acidimicrobiales bacterium]